MIQLVKGIITDNVSISVIINITITIISGFIIFNVIIRESLPLKQQLILFLFD